MNYLPYFVARSAAHRLDERGIRPGLLVRGIGAVCALAVLGLAAVILFAVGDFALWEMGLIP